MSHFCSHVMGWYMSERYTWIDLGQSKMYFILKKYFLIQNKLLIPSEITISNKVKSYKWSYLDVRKKTCSSQHKASFHGENNQLESGRACSTLTIKPVWANFTLRINFAIKFAQLFSFILPVYWIFKRTYYINAGYWLISDQN